MKKRLFTVAEFLCTYFCWIDVKVNETNERKENVASWENRNKMYLAILGSYKMELTLMN